MVKGEVAFRILEALADTAKGFADVFEAFLVSGYGASASKVEYELSKRARARVRDDRERRAKRNYYVVLAKLKRDGLIEVKGRGSGKSLSITNRGRAKFKFLQQRKRDELPRFSTSPQNSENLLIVAFDIPERIRRKRQWLRKVLVQVGLKMVQKSVWMGKVKLPRGFLDALDNLKLIEYVEIFEISKTGTLKHVS